MKVDLEIVGNGVCEVLNFSGVRDSPTVKRDVVHFPFTITSK